MESMSTTAPCRTTGRWRQPTASILRTASGRSSLGEAVSGLGVMTSPISVFSGERFTHTTRRTTSRSLKMPTRRPS